MSSQEKYIHDKFAPYWAATLLLLCVTGLATIWIDLGAFWKGYVLDMTGPAWNYILFRGLFTSYADNKWTRFFTPKKTLIIFLLVCFGIEGAQYFKLYSSTFDPWDFVSYVSILVPLFLLDLVQTNYNEQKNETKRIKSKLTFSQFIFSGTPSPNPPEKHREKQS